MASWRRPRVDIEIDGESKNAKDLYSVSTRDKITGKAIIKPYHDTSFDWIEINLLCNVKAYVHTASPGAITPQVPCFMQLLKLAQPMDENQFPEDRILKAREMYTFEFTFVIPDEVPMNACKHDFKNDELKDAHKRLPPTLGDKQHQKEDFAPDMSKVNWIVRASVLKKQENVPRPIVIQDSNRRIRVIPATDEAPPLNIEKGDEEYNLRREKGMKRRIGKFEDTGRLAIETDQPRSLRLPPPQDTDAEAPSTTAAIVVRFDPSDKSSRPPQFSCLETKLDVITYFSSRARTDYPTRKETKLDGLMSYYQSSVQLSHRNIQTQGWNCHEPGTNPDSLEIRRGSSSGGMGTVNIPGPTRDHKQNLPFYTALLNVPISLPRDKALVPTFHSCFVSRVYALKYTLAVYATGTGSGRAKKADEVSLTVPFQISSATRATSGLPPGGEIDQCITLPGDSRTNSVDQNQDDLEDYLNRPSAASPDRPARRTPVQSPPEYSRSGPSYAPIARTGGAIVDERPIQSVPAYSAFPAVR
ncbi:MAG: hypothetical protein M1831_001781 [Alyxoria varia]|nr:MAG: hypothetical protein M1831_001781 [Alyxoria varia]